MLFLVQNGGEDKCILSESIVQDKENIDEQTQIIKAQHFKSS